MTLMSVTTEATCGDACWYAREDVCRCSCGGKNHGVLLKRDELGNPVERPVRTKRKHDMRFYLAAVLNDWREANEYLRKRGSVRNDTNPWIHYQSASASQKKWPEVANMGFGRPYLIWIKEGVENVEDATPICEGAYCERSYKRAIKFGSDDPESWRNHVMLGATMCSTDFRTRGG